MEPSTGSTAIGVDEHLDALHILYEHAVLVALVVVARVTEVEVRAFDASPALSYNCFDLAVVTGVAIVYMGWGVELRQVNVLSVRVYLLHQVFNVNLFVLSAHPSATVSGLHQN